MERERFKQQQGQSEDGCIYAAVTFDGDEIWTIYKPRKTARDAILDARALTVLSGHYYRPTYWKNVSDFGNTETWSLLPKPDIAESGVCLDDVLKRLDQMFVTKGLNLSQRYEKLEEILTTAGYTEDETYNIIRFVL